VYVYILSIELQSLTTLNKFYFSDLICDVGLLIIPVMKWSRD